MRTWTWVFVCCLASGCLSTPYALVDEADAEPVDERLLGSWVNADNDAERIEVLASGPREYEIWFSCDHSDDCSFSPEEGRALGWVTRLDSRTWMSIRLLDCEDPDDEACSSYLYVLFDAITDSTVSIAFARESENDATVHSREELRDVLSAEGEDLTDFGYFVRVE